MSDKANITWEKAVAQFRANPEYRQGVLDNYFDLPVLPAAKRFAASPEAKEILRLLEPAPGRTILDLGAGNGIASYALAKAGWTVTALEPDPSTQVGTGAIRQWADAESLDIAITDEVGPPLPFPDQYFSAIFGRQVIHHIPDIKKGIAELFRILKPQGIFLATRDHVVDDERQLAQFLDGHPLHRYYGGENAFSLDEYLGAYRSAGFQVLRVYGPLSSVLNYYPGTEDQRIAFVHQQLSQHLGRWATLLRPSIMTSLATSLAEHYYRPAGRIYSFLLRKP